MIILLNSTDIGVIFLDRKLKIRKFTPAATIAIALRNTDIGRPISELAFEIECSDLQSLFLQVLGNQKTVEREVKLNNSNLYLLMRLNPYLSEDGRRNGIVISFVKLNEIKRLQRKLETTLEALRQSEARLNLAISAADIGTWFWKPQDNSFIWDNNVHHLYGLTAVQMPCSLTGWLELVHPNDRPIVEEQIEAAFAAQKSCRVDYRIILPNRRERWLSIRGKVYTDPHSHSHYMAGVTIDITDIRSVQAALKTRKAELGKLNRELEQRVVERTTALANFSENFRELHRLATSKYFRIEDLFDDYLQTGCSILNLATGVISKISGDIYEVLAVLSPQAITSGKKVYCQNNYYGDVVDRKQAIAYAEVKPDAPINQHPIYRDFQLSSFIGTPILVNGTLFDTLSFADTQVRSQEFVPYELEIVELMARDIGQSLASSRAAKALLASEARCSQHFRTSSGRHRSYISGREIY